jgi:hypothetical protein
MRIVTNVQTGTTYTVVPSDCGKLLTLSNAASIGVSIPAAGPSGLASGCWVDIQNTGAGTATFSVNGSTIDGAVQFGLTTNQGLRLVSNGTAYFTQRGQGSGSGGGGGGGGALTIESGGTSLGTASAINVVGGTGVSCVPQVNAGVMTFQCNADTSYLASKASLQGATNPQVCTSSSANGAAYTASCASPLPAYAAKQTLFWYADVANTSTTPTLNIDTLGALPMVHLDGTPLAAGDIKAASLYRIWNDGTEIHVVEAGLGGGTGAGVASPVASIFWPFGPGLQVSANTVTTPLGSANTTMFYEFYLPAPGIVVNNFSVYPNQAVPGHLAIALYDSTCTLMTGGASGTAAGASNVPLNLTASSSISLPGGKYFLAVSGDTAGMQLYGAPPSFISDLANLNEGVGNLHTFTGNSSSGTSAIQFPGTCGTRTALLVTAGHGYPAIALH